MCEGHPGLPRHSQTYWMMNTDRWIPQILALPDTLLFTVFPGVPVYMASVTQSVREFTNLALKTKRHQIQYHLLHNEHIYMWDLSYWHQLPFNSYLSLYFSVLTTDIDCYSKTLSVNTKQSYNSMSCNCNRGQLEWGNCR